MTVQAAAQWLRERDNFLLLTHVRPDGDTLGSAAALCEALNALGKTAYLLKNPGDLTRYEINISTCTIFRNNYRILS